MAAAEIPAVLAAEVDGTGSSTSGSGGGTSGDESKPFMTDKEKMRADLLAAESKLLKQKAKLTAMTESKMR